MLTKDLVGLSEQNLGKTISQLYREDLLPLYTPLYCEPEDSMLTVRTKMSEGQCHLAIIVPKNSKENQLISTEVLAELKKGPAQRRRDLPAFTGIVTLTNIVE